MYSWGGYRQRCPLQESNKIMKNKIHHFTDDRDMAIRISWAINCGLNFYPLSNNKGKTDADILWLIRKHAEEFLDTFDEMKQENNVCVVCNGLASNLNPVTNGMHAKCRQDEAYKVSQKVV